MNEPREFTTLTHPDVRISARDFGAIASGSVDLRPLTVFVGPSNTGKTYFATLVYALHRVLSGFPRFPSMFRYRSHTLRTLEPAGAILDKGELHEVIERLKIESRPFRFSDLPQNVRHLAQAALEDPKLLGAALKAELMRCFDLDSSSNLVRFSGHTNGMKISLSVSEDDQDLWCFGMGVSESDMTTQGQIENMILLPERWSALESKSGGGFNRFQRISERWRNATEINDEYLLESFFAEFLYLGRANTTGQGQAHYLPAARSGIMQSHRVIASSLVARSVSAGLEPFPEIPTLSGVTVDFMQQLILYEEDRWSDEFRTTTMGQPSREPIKNVADTLESEALAGQIRSSSSLPGMYPEFVYRPRGTEVDIRLSRASSMVSELAPVVLFLRGAVAPGDLLIIEEPEAHLHPAAQTQMAVTIARMVRAGVRVLATTHSDWLLKEIGNLIREGELEQKTGESTDGETLPSSLRASEVGIWLFRKDGTSGGSTIEEIPFDRSEGVEPPDYEDVAEELYNRSANLQNRFEETAEDAGREDE